MDFDETWVVMEGEKKERKEGKTKVNELTRGRSTTRDTFGTPISFDTGPQQTSAPSPQSGHDIGETGRRAPIPRARSRDRRPLLILVSPTETSPRRKLPGDPPIYRNFRLNKKSNFSPYCCNKFQTFHFPCSLLV